MHASTARNTLRTSEREWRASPKANRPAPQPVIAGFLATLASNFADSAQPIVESWPFIVFGLAVAIALYVGSAMGVLPV